jgi:hypothetical protein
MGGAGLRARLLKSVGCAPRTEPRLGKVGVPANASISLNYLVPGTHPTNHIAEHALISLQSTRKS